MKMEQSYKHSVKLIVCEVLVIATPQRHLLDFNVRLKIARHIDLIELLPFSPTFRLRSLISKNIFVVRQFLSEDFISSMPKMLGNSDFYCYLWMPYWWKLIKNWYAIDETGIEANPGQNFVFKFLCVKHSVNVRIKHWYMWHGAWTHRWF